MGDIKAYGGGNPYVNAKNMKTNSPQLQSSNAINKLESMYFEATHGEFGALVQAGIITPQDVMNMRSDMKLALSSDHIIEALGGL